MKRFTLNHFQLLVSVISILLFLIYMNFYVLLPIALWTVCLILLLCIFIGRGNCKPASAIPFFAATSLAYFGLRFINNYELQQLLVGSLFSMFFLSVGYVYELLKNGNKMANEREAEKIPLWDVYSGQEDHSYQHVDGNVGYTEITNPMVASQVSYLEALKLMRKVSSEDDTKEAWELNENTFAVSSHQYSGGCVTINLIGSITDFSFEPRVDDFVFKYNQRVVIIE